VFPSTKRGTTSVHPTMNAGRINQEGM
jgi:hypothetical protein